MSKNIYVFVEQRDGKTQKVAFELIGKARELAAQLDQQVYGLVIGSNIAGLADELIARGVECDYNTILSDIEHRDYEDENRELAPLKQASDAIVIDTSDMTIEEASDKITELFKNKKEEYERNHKG